MSAAPYHGLIREEEGTYYNGNLVEKSSDLIQDAVRRNNANPFLVVNPRIARDRAKHIVDLEFDIAQGPRTYVERIDISGNTVTRDRVIRREFRFAEGDPNDPALDPADQAAADGSGLFRRREGDAHARLGGRPRGGQHRADREGDRRALARAAAIRPPLASLARPACGSTT